MGRKDFSTTAVGAGWELPADDAQSVRRYLYVTPAGLALGDLMSIVAYALVGGLALAGVVILLLVVLARWDFWASWRWGVMAGLVPLGLLGLACLRLIVALVNAALERILGVDLDASGEVGDVSSLRLEITNQADRAIHFLDLDVDRMRLATLARLALAGRLGERDVAGVLSRRQWGELRQRLMDRGYLAWRNPDEPRSGLILTSTGVALFERLGEALEVNQ